MFREVAFGWFRLKSKVQGNSLELEPLT